ncbi:MAG: sulfatase-like hydrolase/transferase [Gemmobacter sp.]
MTAWRLGLAALLLHLVLIQPNHPGAVTWGAFALFPLELPVILALLVALPGRLVALRAGLVVVLVAGAVLKLADLATHAALGRGFNPVVDWHLLDSGWRLGAGAVGTNLMVLAAAGAGLAVVLVSWALWWATGVWAALAPAATGRRVAGTLAAASALLALAEIGWAMGRWSLPLRPPGAAFTARLLVERAVTARRTLADLSAFRTAAATDPAAGLTDALGALRGRDVLVVFIESYARTSFDNPLYAPRHRAILRAAEAPIAATGMAMASGWLTSPIEGGQSWLAHATLSSGLRIPDEVRYDALLASPRRTLYQIAQGAGWHTAAVSPAITMPWPEGARLGFGTLLDRDAMAYAGQPFNWVTMPDQFTLARFRDRLPATPRPLFAQVTLISSHAPWVPVPTPVLWDAIGDGTVFDPMTKGSDPPQVVWQDADRIREQYAQAIAYSLTVVTDWAARQGREPGPDAPLIIVLGDHPPAAFVNQTGSRDVPIHLIGPREVLAAVQGWGLTPGLIPTADGPVWPMESFRDRFLAAFDAAQ